MTVHEIAIFAVGIWIGCIMGASLVGIIWWETGKEQADDGETG